MMAGAAELGVQGVQLHTHYLLLPLIKTIHFPKIFMNITSLHTHILEASAATETDGFVWTYASRVPAFDRASN